MENRIYYINRNRFGDIDDENDNGEELFFFS